MVLLVGLMICVYKAIASAPANKGLQRTALCAREIRAFLKAGISPTAFLIYECAAAEAQAVRRQPSIPSQNNSSFDPLTTLNNSDRLNCGTHVW